MKRKYGTIQKALTALITAVLLLVCAGALLITTSAKAEGGPSWLPEDDRCAFTVQMDVNGRSASSVGDYDDFKYTGNDTVDSNNAKLLRTRRISFDALLAGYVKRQNPAGVAGQEVNYTSLNFKIDAIDNQYTNYIDARLDGVGTTNGALLLEALSYKSDSHPVYLRLNASNPNSATNRLPTSISIYLKIQIGSTFVAATGDPQAPDSVISGIDDRRTLYIKDDTPLSLGNGEIISFDIADLVSKEFYYLNTSANNAETPLRETKESEIAWLLRDAKYLSISGIEGVTSGNRTESRQTIIVNPSNCTNAAIEDAYLGTATPQVLINVAFNETTVHSVDAQMGTDAFWNETHYLYFTLKTSALSAGSASVRIGKAVRFKTSGAPTIRSDMQIVTDLNVSSAHEYLVGSSSNAEHQSDGFSSVLISPSHITDYPCTSKQGQYFDATMAPTFEGSAVQVEFVEQAYPVTNPDTQEVTYTPSWRVTAKERGDVVVTFKIQYNGTQVKEVPVSFNIYGGYAISIDTLKGKRAQSYRTTTANEFSALITDKYFLTSVSVAEGDAATVDLNSGIMTLTPKADGNVRLKFEFANLNGKTVTVYSTVRIDYSANGFFVMFEDWQAWLIIASAIVVGIGLILLVVWLFIRSVSKRREAELATTAPTSSYIIKLNSTIAAAQAQQRMATQAFTNTQTQMLQLGAGAGATTTGTTQPLNTLQLGEAPPPPAGVTPPTNDNDSYPSTSDRIVTPPPSDADEIYIPLTDEELLERIYVEKYEPRGMVRRTFFKSKELQARELEKEKARIREEVRNGTPIEEAIKSKAQREQEGGAVVPETPIEEVKEEVTVVTLLGFDPNAPLLPEEEPFAPDENAAPEEIRLQESERRLARLETEYKVICERQTKADDVTAKQTAEAEETDKSINSKREYADTLKEDLTQLEIKLATAKNKDKEKINKDIESKERVQKDTLAAAEKLAAELTVKRQLLTELESVSEKLTADKSTWE